MASSDQIMRVPSIFFSWPSTPVHCYQHFYVNKPTFYIEIQHNDKVHYFPVDLIALL